MLARCATDYFETYNGRNELRVGGRWGLYVRDRAEMNYKTGPGRERRVVDGEGEREGEGMVKRGREGEGR